MKRSLGIALAILLFAGLLAGCGNAGQGAPTQASAGSAGSAGNAGNSTSAGGAGGTSEADNSTGAGEAGSAGGAGNAGGTASSVSQETQSEASATAESPDSAGSNQAGVSYPLEGGATLSIAIVEEAQVTANAKTLGDTPLGQAWQKNTGVTLEFQHPSSDDAMNLLFASGDLPDIVITNFNSYTGGPVKAIKDRIVEPLDSYIDECAPDLKAILNSNDLYRKSTSSADGHIIGFPFIRGDEMLLVAGGLMVRQDWLDDLGLGVPQTPDDMYETLKAFRDEKGAEVPFSVGISWLRDIINHGVITSPFGLPKADFYQRDGEVHYGAAEAEYRDVLAYLNKLCAEGLLDPSFASIDGNTQNANIMNGDSGITAGALGGGLGNYLQTMEETDPGYNLTGFGPLVARPGDTAMSTRYENPVVGIFAVITPNCANKEAAAQLLNYGYTEAGNLLFNFGIEGESYLMKNGVPTYTELITRNPNGLTMRLALAQYTRAWAGGGAFVQDAGYMVQYAARPQQQAALKAWSDSSASLYKLPPVSISEADSAEYSRLMSDIDTYVSEMLVKFVAGLEPLDGFDAYISTLEQMGIGRVIELQQNALIEFGTR
jgi:putative aldouronate transport system substrate-binding protein